MNYTYIILLILLVIYIPFYIYVRKSEKMAALGIVPYGPLVMIKTKWGLKLMDRLSKHKKVWRFFGLASRVIALFLMVFIIGILVIDVFMLPNAIGKGGIGIEYALAIPGLNPMLPLVYGIIGLIIAMVIHELAHGIQTRANDMDVESSGILYGVVPLGAFVEPNDEQVKKCSRRARMDLYAAGIATNFIAAAVLFIVIFATLSGGLTSNYENNPAISNIVADSPASGTNMPATSVITGINDTTIASIDDLRNSIPEYGEYTIRYVYENKTLTASNVKLGVHISSVVTDSPADIGGLKKGCFLTSITANGIETKLGSSYAFSEFMNTTSNGEAVTVSFLDTNGTTHTSMVILGSGTNGIGYLGIVQSTSGFIFTTPGTMLQKATNPFYNCDTITECAMGAISYIGSPFSGYSPVPEATHWWYESNFLPNDIFWIVMSLLFWTFWLNLVLGVSNALPAIPFDGGFLFMGGIDFILEKLGVSSESREKKVNSITSVSTYITLMVLVVVMIVIIF